MWQHTCLVVALLAGYAEAFGYHGYHGYQGYHAGYHAGYQAASKPCTKELECIVDPCKLSLCPSYPNATCTTKCGTCRPQYMEDGKPVRCTNVVCEKMNSTTCNKTCETGYQRDFRGCERCACSCKRQCVGGWAKYEPLCGDNEKTYRNRCSMNYWACRQGKTIKVAHPGKCVPKKCPQLDCGASSMIWSRMLQALIPARCRMIGVVKCKETGCPTCTCKPRTRGGWTGGRPKWTGKKTTLTRKTTLTGRKPTWTGRKPNWHAKKKISPPWAGKPKWVGNKPNWSGRKPSWSGFRPKWAGKGNNLVRSG